MKSDREIWVGLLEKLARPVLENLAAGTLKRNMPVECGSGREADRKQYTYLETIARLLCGIAPFLELNEVDDRERGLQSELREWARKAIASAVNRDSPDYMNFSLGQQPIVDAAFLAHAMLRSPVQLWEKLDERVRHAVVVELMSLRNRKPALNNWLLFSAMSEVLIDQAGAGGDPMRIDYAIRQHEQWYKGDGVYGDGPSFHWDYYNSFVIHPMLLDIVERAAAKYGEYRELLEAIRQRSIRYACIQERMIAPDGSFPPIGRSLTYRCGAFQSLAMTALRGELPAEVNPAQVRGALTAVIRKTLEAPGTFDEKGWLTIGLCGHQPSLGEVYISTGSLYLCAAAFLPLGLPASDPFWKSPSEPWTSVKAFSGVDLPADHAM